MFPGPPTRCFGSVCSGSDSKARNPLYQDGLTDWQIQVESVKDAPLVKSKIMKLIANLCLRFVDLQGYVQARTIYENLPTVFGHRSIAQSTQNAQVTGLEKQTSNCAEKPQLPQWFGLKRRRVQLQIQTTDPNHHLTNDYLMLLTPY